jgi:hypothetical protein
VLKFEFPCGGSLSKKVSPAYEEKFSTGTYLKVWILGIGNYDDYNKNFGFIMI